MPTLPYYLIEWMNEILKWMKEEKTDYVTDFHFKLSLWWSKKKKLLCSAVSWHNGNSYNSKYNNDKCARSMALEKTTPVTIIKITITTTTTSVQKCYKQNCCNCSAKPLYKSRKTTINDVNGKPCGTYRKKTRLKKKKKNWVKETKLNAKVKYKKANFISIKNNHRPKRT